MQYAILVYERRGAYDGLTDDQLRAITAEYLSHFHSTRAELLRRLGRVEEARGAYQRALELIRTAPERRFLERRLLESS